MKWWFSKAMLVITGGYGIVRPTSSLGLGSPMPPSQPPRWEPAPQPPPRLPHEDCDAGTMEFSITAARRMGHWWSCWSGRRFIMETSIAGIPQNAAWLTLWKIRFNWLHSWYLYLYSWFSWYTMFIYWWIYYWHTMDMVFFFPKLPKGTRSPRQFLIFQHLHPISWSRFE